MKTAELKASIRQKTGAHVAKMLRKDNKIPAVVYGESGTQHIEVEYLPMSKLLHSPDLYLININTGEATTRVIIQDAQFHPLSDKILHVDFKEAAVGKPAVLRLPVHFLGTASGVTNGGVLDVKLHHLKVKGVPAEMPEFIDVDITNLEIGKSIKAGDIKGYNIMDTPNSVIIRCKTARKLEEIVPAEGAAVPAEGEAAEGAEKAEAKEEKAE